MDSHNIHASISHAFIVGAILRTRVLTWLLIRVQLHHMLDVEGLGLIWWLVKDVPIHACLFFLLSLLSVLLFLFNIGIYYYVTIYHLWYHALFILLGLVVYLNILIADLLVIWINFWLVLLQVLVSIFRILARRIRVLRLLLVLVFTLFELGSLDALDQYLRSLNFVHVLF